MTARTLIGTSGWSYEHWAGDFYRPGLPPRERLAYYAARFPTVEINATFYRLPSESAVRGWRQHVPGDFRFAVKGSRYVTHIRRLKNAEDAVGRFISRVGLLGDGLAVVLWQLPPAITPDLALLDSFLAVLPQGLRHAVEFRSSAWLRDDVFAVLRKHNTAHVHVSSDLMPAELTTTADFVYVRLHGLAAEHGAYPAAALASWADFLTAQHAAGRDAYVYFNNDAGGQAPRDAARLREMIARSSAS